MRNIWNTAIWKTRWVLKMKSSLVNLFVLPIVFALIFGGIQSDQPVDNSDYLTKVGIVSDSTRVDNDILKDIIGYQLNSEVVSYDNKEKAEQSLKDGNVLALVLWENEFEKMWTKQEKTSWELIYEKQTTETFMMEQQMNQLLRGLNAVSLIEKDSSLFPEKQVELWFEEWQKYRGASIGVNIQYGQQEPEGDSGNEFSRYFIGFTIMFLMFALNSSASTILEEKNMGTWNRLLLAPLNKYQLIFGNILHFLIIGLLQFFVLIVFSSLVFNVNWGNYLDVLIFAIIIILSVSGLGFVLATIVKTRAQQGVIGAIVITATCMIGGVYWPLAYVSDTMRMIANFVPQKWAMEGMLQLMSGGYRLNDIITSIEVLLIFMVIFYVIGFIRFRKI